LEGSELTEKIETSLPSENSGEGKIVETKIGEQVFRYPLWWTTFVIFKREGCSGTEAYRRSRPELDITDDNCGVRASLLLKDRDFQRFVTELEKNTIGEIEQWKRTSFHRVKKLQRVIDKSISDEMKPKDIQAIASSEKILQEMGNSVLGIKNDDEKVQVQVNVAGIISNLLSDSVSTKTLPKDIVSKFGKPT
jgi:hypothetical protein